MLREVVDAGLAWGANAVGVVDSGLPGPKGNREFFVHLINRDDPVLLDDIDERIDVPSQQAKAVKRAAVITHGKPQTIGPALARLTTVAREAGVELKLEEDEAEKHGLAPADGDSDIDLVVVLGGDGTMLRALARYLGTGVPVIGVNFGRVGFLSSIARDELEAGLARVFAGEYTVEELPTLEVEVGSERRVAVNDLVVTSGVARAG